jgi:hypothetical protein
MSESLIASVPDRFQPLSEAEKRMLETATKGEPAICGQNDKDDDPDNAPSNGQNWLPSRTIRADILEWLCTTDIAAKVGRQGIHIYAAKITGILKFAYTSISFPLRFQRCVFTHDISFKHARIPSLILDGSWTRTILADGIDVANNVLLIAGFHSIGQVLFRDAKIGGNFRTDGALFEYAEGTTFDLQSENSLGCDRMNVNGGVFLSRAEKPAQSTFKGEVGLAGAFIGSNLECDGGTFHNQDKIAIRADRIKVIGAVYLRNQFSSKGAVRFLNAQMDVFDCGNGTFDGDGTIALIAQDATITKLANFDGAVFQRGDAQFRGLTTGDVIFRASKLTLLDLRYATIRRALRLKRIVDPQQSSWDFRNASAGSIDDDQKSWPNPGGLFVDGFSYDGFGTVVVDSQGDPDNCPRDLKSRLVWITLDTRNSTHAYKQLASVYSKVGDTLNSRETLYALEILLHRLRISEETWAICKLAQWAWSQWLKLTIGYGYKLSRSFWWLLLFSTLGYAVSCVGYRDRVIAPTDKDAYTYFIQHGQAPDYYPRFSPFVFTIEHSVPAINFGISNNWSADSVAQISAHPCYASSIRNGLLAQRLLGWILSIFFIAGITGLVKSDK